MSLSRHAQVRGSHARPDSGAYRYHITDAFEKIVLYDNKTLTATYVQMRDKKYKVTLTVHAKKLKSNGSGTETPMPMADCIDISVFSGKKDHEKPLYLKKEKLTQKKRPLRSSSASSPRAPASTRVTG